MTTTISGSSPSLTFSDGTTQTTAFSSTTAVTSLAAGTGVSLSGSTGGITITNSGVTSLSGGTGISISGSTGSISISSTDLAASSFASNGYIKTTGGLIIQWGQAGPYTSSNANQSVSFNVTFPNACFSVQLTANWSTQSNMQAFHTNSYSTTGFTIYNPNAASGWYYAWVAIGY